MITKKDTYKKAFELKKSILKEKNSRYNMLLSAAYTANPRLKEIEQEQLAIGADLALSVMSGKASVTDIKKHSEALAAEKKVILDKCGIKPIEYDCDICKDTGYINGKICSCIKKAASAILADEMSDSMPLDNSRFDNFNLNYYSDKDTKEGNPRRRMTSIFKVCTEYCLNFNPKGSRNLLFLGSAGLGKTHLSLAVVSQLIDKGFLPVYGSAENLFYQIEKERFSGENRGTYEMFIECDLLVIDDLGAEMATTFTKSSLYNIVNSRILSGRPTIINTNLSMKEIETRYTARISSRLIGNFDAYKFLGDDIRQQKAIERMNKG